MIKIEIWSDINCPFCYIGKRHLEAALADFPQKNLVDIVWRSFELDPHTHPAKGADSTDLLAKKYGRDRQWALEMNRSMEDLAKKVNLNFQLDRVIAANSFNAHRLLQMAKDQSAKIQNELYELLFSYKFIEGKDISDFEVLREAGATLGMKPQAINEMLRSDQYTYEVRLDEEVAGGLNIRGVPYFYFNKQIAISGARPIVEFSNALEKCGRFEVSRMLD